MLNGVRMQTFIVGRSVVEIDILQMKDWYLEAGMSDLGWMILEVRCSMS